MWCIKQQFHYLEFVMEILVKRVKPMNKKVVEVFYLSLEIPYFFKGGF